MGEAKRRKGEIETRKSSGPRIDPSRNPEPTAALALRLHAMLEAAKQDGNINPAVDLLHAKLDATIQGFGQLPIACKKGCSHCCHTRVSATAPELLVIAKIIKNRGNGVIERVKKAHLQTKEFDLHTRAKRPYPCPLLEEGICSIYDFRPKACRLAASGDASICARAILDLTGERIPAPVSYEKARTVYVIALTVALKRSNLPYAAYELNAGLVRAIDFPDAERAWLGGKDIFADVPRDPVDPFAEPATQAIFRHAFG